MTACLLIGYLAKKGKTRQIREVVRGLSIWYAAVLAVALFNPLAAMYLFVSRFLGGAFITLITFYQHGLVDPNEVHEVHANTIDYAGSEHGNLGFDYHVEHHLRPARHWSHYYEEFARASEKDAGHPAIVMQRRISSVRSRSSPRYGARIIRRSPATLASTMSKNDAEELARIVRERARPIGAPERSGISADIDGLVSRVMAVALPKSFAV